MQSYQKRSNLGVGTLAGENLRHHFFRFRARKRLAMIGDGMKRVENHGLLRLAGDPLSVPVFSSQTKADIKNGELKTGN
jgi:hypothetical protein